VLDDVEADLARACTWLKYVWASILPPSIPVVGVGFEGYFDGGEEAAERRSMAGVGGGRFACTRRMYVAGRGGRWRGGWGAGEDDGGRQAVLEFLRPVCQALARSFVSLLGRRDPSSSERTNIEWTYVTFNPSSLSLLNGIEARNNQIRHLHFLGECPSLPVRR
jgi:hypothetical protein